jgi:hypothetical protein
MNISARISTGFVALVLALPVFAQQAGPTAVLWRDRGEVAALNLLEGPGGKTRAPGTNFKFIAESKNGTSPKFDVEDENGAKWKVKLGPEVKAETAATRLVWAAGYFTNEDYYRPQIRVQGMKPLSRGKQRISEGGLVREVRLKRDDDKKPKDWSWYETRVSGTREFNGLRVMMALINNWDLKADNNSLYDQGNAGEHYLVSDLGASFGRTGSSFSRSKGVMMDYVQTSFVNKVTSDHADFVMHSRPFFLLYVFRPNYYSLRARMERVTKDVPLADARWLGNLLGQFSTAQIGDCFRAAGFSPAEVAGYTQVVMQRINSLKKL